MTQTNADVSGTGGTAWTTSRTGGWKPPVGKGKKRAKEKARGERGALSFDPLLALASGLRPLRLVLQRDARAASQLHGI
jgi:hypothetical protein